MGTAQKYLIVVLLAGLFCNGYSTPLQDVANTQLTTINRQRRDIHDIASNLINELVANLQQSAADATNSVANFTIALGEEARLFNEQLLQDIDNLKTAVQQAIDEAKSKVVQVTEGLVDCVENEKEDAENLLNSTLSQVTDCVTERLDRFADQLSELAELSSQATAAADEALLKAQQCGQQGIFAGICLAGALIETQNTSVTIAGQIGMLITRISLGVNSLSVTLSVCTSARLAEAGLRLASLLFNIGQCAVTAIVTGA